MYTSDNRKVMAAPYLLSRISHHFPPSPPHTPSPAHHHPIPPCLLLSLSPPSISFLSLLHTYSVNKQVHGVCPVGSLEGMGGDSLWKGPSPSSVPGLSERQSLLLAVPRALPRQPPRPWNVCASPALFEVAWVLLTVAFSANSRAVRGSVPRGDEESSISGLSADRWICKHSHLVWDLVYFFQSLTEHISCKKFKWPWSIM